MKKIRTIENTMRVKITWCHLVLFLVTLPFDRFYSQLVFISLALHTIIHFNKNKARLLLNGKVLLLQSVFFLTVLATFYSSYNDQAFGAWEKQMAILVFPAIMVLNPSPGKEAIEKLLLVFGYTITAVVIYLYIDAFRIIHYYDMPWRKIISSTFLNHNFSNPIGLHATYLSLYAALSEVVFLNAFIRSSSRKQKSIYALCMVVLAAGLLQLASRSVLIALLIIIHLLSVLFFKQPRQRILYFSFTLLAGAVFVFCIVQTNSLHQRFVGGLKNDLETGKQAYMLTDPRAERWELAIGLIKSSPIYGYGTGSEIPLLKEQYFDHKLYDSYLNELNAHNQYLSFLLKTGIIGLVVFLFLLGYMLKLAWEEKNVVFIAFLLLVSIVCFSENILDVNKGIFFFSFFLSLFVLGYRRETETTSDTVTGNPAKPSDVFIYNQALTS